MQVSGVSHANLYAHGYGQIPFIGTAFLFQASVLLAVATLALVGGPAWLAWVAGVLAKGLGDAFTPDTRLAWETAYGTLSAVMIAASQPAHA